MMHKVFLFICACLLTGVTHAQKEQNNWYFGQYAALNFDNGVAQPVTPPNGLLLMPLMIIM